MFETYVQYEPGKRNIDNIVSFHEGELVGGYGKTPLKPNLMMIPLDHAVELIDDLERDFYETGWVETTQDEYWEMLEVLPPIRFTTIQDIQFFFVGEATSGAYHACYAKKEDKYLCQTISRYTPTQEILDGINNAL